MLRNFMLLGVATLLFSNNAYAADTPPAVPAEELSSQAQLQIAQEKANAEINRTISSDIAASSDNDLKEILRNLSVLDDPDKTPDPIKVSVKNKKAVKDVLTKKIGSAPQE